MASSSVDNSVTEEVRIVRGRVDSLSLYEITDNELKTLERGSPNSIYLNFAIFLLSVGVSFLISLLSAKMENVRVYATFLVFTIVGLIGGAILLCLWWRERGAIKEVIEDIKKRIPNSEVVKVQEDKTEDLQVAIK